MTSTPGNPGVQDASGRESGDPPACPYQCVRVLRAVTAFNESAHDLTIPSNDGFEVATIGASIALSEAYVAMVNVTNVEYMTFIQSKMRPETRSAGIGGEGLDASLLTAFSYLLEATAWPGIPEGVDMPADAPPRKKRYQLKDAISKPEWEKLQACVRIWRRHVERCHPVTLPKQVATPAEDQIEDERSSDHASATAEVRGGVAPYAFRRDGDIWLVTFAGESKPFVHAAGFTCLHRLIEQQGHPVDVCALDGLRDARMEHGAAHEYSLDEHAREAYRERLKDLGARIGEARQRGDEALEQRLSAEHDELAKAIRQALGLRGRPRRKNPEIEKARNRVRRAIGRARASLREHLPKFDAHLEEALISPGGMSPTYAPKDEIVWVTR